MAAITPPSRQEPEPGFSPASGRFYRPELDVLRLMAFLMVFCAHAVPPSRASLHAIAQIGTLGVCLFFVLSSYLITELLHLEKQRTRTISIKAFYIRRVLRIWPLLLFILMAAWLFGIAHPPSRVPGYALAYLLLFSGNSYVPHYGYGPSFIGQLWSISVEEQFYLLWPGLMLVFRERFAMLVAGLLLPIAAIAISWLSHHGANPVNAVFPNSLVQFQMFGLGALLSVALRRMPRSLPVYQRALIFLAACILFWLSVCKLGIRANANPGALFLVAGFLCAGIGSCLFLTSVLGVTVPGWMAPLRYLGKVSYGLYVFHGAALEMVDFTMGSSRSPLGAVLKACAAFALTAGAAAISYQFLELPFIKLKERFAIIKSRAA